MTPAVVEVGNAVVLNCSSKTTIVPETHNLTISTSWYLDGQAIKPCGRFSVDSNGLYIYVVTEADIDLVITCEAKEERGLTTRINTTLPIFCKCLISFGKIPQSECSIFVVCTPNFYLFSILFSFMSRGRTLCMLCLNRQAFFDCSVYVF